MKKRKPDFGKIERLLRRCLDEGVSVSFFLPYRNVRNPSWNELEQYATECYATALQDVSNAMKGDSEALQEAMPDGGRLVIREEDRDLLIERLESAMEDPSGVFHDDDD